MLDCFDYCESCNLSGNFGTAKLYLRVIIQNFYTLAFLAVSYDCIEIRHLGQGFEPCIEYRWKISPTLCRKSRVLRGFSGFLAQTKLSDWDGKNG